MLLKDHAIPFADSAVKLNELLEKKHRVSNVISLNRGDTILDAKRQWLEGLVPDGPRRWDIECAKMDRWF